MFTAYMRLPRKIHAQAIIFKIELIEDADECQVSSSF